MSPFTVEPGKFTYRLVRGELEYAKLRDHRGPLPAGPRRVPIVVVPLTLLPPVVMPFAAALSTHPVTAHAIGEVTGPVLETLGRHPDLALLFVTRPHAGALEDAAAAVRRILSPSVLIGCAAESVVGGGLEVEEAPGVSLWAGHGRPVAADPAVDRDRRRRPPDRADWPARAAVRAPGPGPAGRSLHLPRRRPDRAASPRTAPACRCSAAWHRRRGGRAATGWSSTAPSTPPAPSAPSSVPAPRLVTVVSQGCRPIGRPLVVTRAERNIVYELAGRPALERLLEMARTACPNGTSTWSTRASTSAW